MNVPARLYSSLAAPRDAIGATARRAVYPALGFVVVGILVLGCAENRAVDPVQPAFGLSSAPGQMARSRGSIDSLAKGLALALGDAGVRARLRDDLRDSPFPLHAIHLGSYLRGVDGGTIAVKAAAALGIGLDAFISMSESGPELELVMPRPLDRVSWDGGDDLDVTATQSSFRQRKEAGRVSEGGYDVKGNAKSVRTFRYSARPYIILRPAEAKFPAEAERLRVESPKHAWNTVTTPAEERALMRQRGRQKVAAEKAARLTSASGLMLDGGPQMTILPCTPDCPSGGSSPPGVGGGGATLSSIMTKSYCYGVTAPLNTTTDRDNDRVRDDCELALASRLAPLLNIGDWDNARERQPYWAVSRHPDRPDNIQIIYALAFVQDAGADQWGTGHEGDSEFIVLEAKSVSASKWGIIEATLSAHFNAEEFPYPGSGYYAGADSYYWDDLDYPQGPFPRIWSALDKHANYRNRAACEAGAFLWLDSCAGPYVGTQIPVTEWRNLGNYYHVPSGSRNATTWKANCTQWEGSPLVNFVYRTGMECFWTESYTSFSGWDPAKPDGATPYWKILRIFEF